MLEVYPSVRLKTAQCFVDAAQGWPVFCRCFSFPRDASQGHGAAEVAHYAKLCVDDYSVGPT